MRRKSILLYSKILLLTFFTIGCGNNSANDAETQKQPSEKSAENSDNWRTFSSGDFYGYEDENGFEMLPAKYLSAEEFNNGIAIVETENGFCLIDFNGKILSDFYEEIISDNYKDSSTLNYIAKKISEEKSHQKENKKSFDFNDLQLDLPPEMENFETDLNLFESNRDSFCLLSKKGERISPFYNNIESNELGFYIGSIVDEQDEKEEFLLDSSGNKISDHFDAIDVAGEIFIAYNNQKDYLMNTKGEIISKGYNTINYLSDLDLYEAEIDFFNNSTGILDKNGAIKIPEKYYEIEWFDNLKLFLVTKYSSRKYQGLYSENFELVKAPEQHIECTEDNPYIAISNGNKFSFYTYDNGTFEKKSDDFDVIKNDYSNSKRFLLWDVKFSGTDYILAKFYDGFASVSKNGKFGIINDKFEVVLPFEYDFCYDRFNDGKCFVVKGEDEFYVNKKGERVSE